MIKIYLIVFAICWLQPTMAMPILPMDKSYILQIPKSWKLIDKTKQIYLFERKVIGHKLKAFKGVVHLKYSILRILSVLRDIENSHKWTPNLQKKTIISENTYTDAVTYNLNKLPWPFSNRDTVLRSKLEFNNESNRLRIFTESVEHEAVPPKNGIVRGIVYNSSIYFHPTKDGTIIDLDAHIDPMGYLPNFLINFIQKKWPFNFLTSLAEQAKNVKVNNHPELLKFVEKITK